MPSPPSSSPSAEESADRLRSLFAPSIPFRMNVRQCTAALGRLAEAIAAHGPVSAVIAVPGARGVITPAETLAAYLGSPLHQTEPSTAPPTGLAPEGFSSPDLPQLVHGRVLVFAERPSCVALTQTVDQLRHRLAPDAVLETAALVLRSRYGPSPNWWAWSITDAHVIFPWDYVEPGVNARAMPDLQEVHSA